MKFTHLIEVKFCHTNVGTLHTAVFIVYEKKVSSSLPKTSQSEDTGIFSVFVCLYQLQLIHSLIACFY